MSLCTRVHVSIDGPILGRARISAASDRVFEMRKMRHIARHDEYRFRGNVFSKKGSRKQQAILATQTTVYTIQTFAAQVQHTHIRPLSLSHMIRTIINWNGSTNTHSTNLHLGEKDLERLEQRSCFGRHRSPFQSCLCVK